MRRKKVNYQEKQKTQINYIYPKQTARGTSSNHPLSARHPRLKTNFGPPSPIDITQGQVSAVPVIKMEVIVEDPQRYQTR